MLGSRFSCSPQVHNKLEDYQSARMVSTGVEVEQDVFLDRSVGAVLRLSFNMLYPNLDYCDKSYINPVVVTEVDLPIISMSELVHVFRNTLPDNIPFFKIQLLPSCCHGAFRVISSDIDFWRDSWGLPMRDLGDVCLW